MFFKIAGSPYDGSKKALPTAKLKMCIIKGKKACQVRTAQKTAIRTHCISLKFRCFFDMIAPL